MQTCLKTQAIEKQHSFVCCVTEYPLDNKLLNMAIAKISGRYPDERFVLNLECAELAYVFEGKGKIVVNDQEHLLKAGDVVLIETGEKYYWEGHMQLFLSCSPAWYEKQHQIVD